MTRAKVVEIPRKAAGLEFKDGGVVVHDKRELWVMAQYSEKRFRKLEIRSTPSKHSCELGWPGEYRQRASWRGSRNASASGMARKARM